MQETYTLNGQLHKDYGPAYVTYFANGKPSQEIYYQYGQKHRDDGPAEILYFSNGGISALRFYQNGELVDQEHFQYDEQQAPYVKSARFGQAQIIRALQISKGDVEAAARLLSF